MISKLEPHFENSDINADETRNYRREGKVNTQALHKTSQKKSARRHGSKRRIVNATLALRDWGCDEKISHYNIYSLSERLFNLGYDKLSEWRYASKVTTAFSQLALRQLELEDNERDKPETEKLRLMPFVLNLSESIQDKMIRSKRKEMTICKNEINRSLRAVLGRCVDMWFQYEMAPKGNKGKPHIQGSMLISISEMRIVKKAMHKVNGKVTSDFKRYAFRIRLKKRYQVAKVNGLLYADLNWASYCAKERGRTLLTFVDQDLDDWGRVVSCGNSLNVRAKVLYEELRRLLKNQVSNIHLY